MQEKKEGFADGFINSTHNPPSALWLSTPHPASLCGSTFAYCSRTGTLRTAVSDFGFSVELECGKYHPG